MTAIKSIILGVVLTAIGTAYYCSPVILRWSGKWGFHPRVVRIAYGLPSEALIQKARRGEVLLGGCEKTDDSPKWALLI
jgi:hypothetical protein